MYWFFSQLLWNLAHFWGVWGRREPFKKRRRHASRHNFFWKTLVWSNLCQQEMTSTWYQHYCHRRTKAFVIKKETAFQTIFVFWKCLPSMNLFMHNFLNLCRFKFTQIMIRGREGHNGGQIFYLGIDGVKPFKIFSKTI